MATKGGKKGSWDKDNAGVEIRRDEATNRILVSHPAYPFIRYWDEPNQGATGLFEIANSYLQALGTDSLGVPPRWLADLSQFLPGSTPPGSHQQRPHLLWLPLNPGGPGDPDRDPRNSFWVERFEDLASPTAATRIDRTAVLLACLYDSPDRVFGYRGGQGIRMHMHIDCDPSGSGICPVRITGLTSTVPDWPRNSPPFRGLSIGVRQINALQAALREVFVLSEQTKIAELGLRIEAPKQRGAGPNLEVTAKTIPGAGARRGETPYALFAQLASDGTTLLPIAKTALIASAVQAKVFDCDPMTKYGKGHFDSKRPHRASAALDGARALRPLNIPAGPGGTNVLDDGVVVVTKSRFGDLPGGTEDDPRLIDPTVAPATRSNESAAINAYYHASTLFSTLALYGIVASAYFKFVAPRLTVRYRAGISPGALHGDTVNAQVTLLPPELNIIEGPPPQAEVITPGKVEVRLALGDLRLSPRHAPLGIACDPRWNWHEFCHVLLAAAVGELEFRFAHSAGDAMAAIRFDPLSELPKDGPENPWRGVTFPWVSLPARRHDRPVNVGWGWNGSLYQRDRFYVVPGHCDKRGYWSEQILSSSLFRLYRAIGGDSALDAAGKPYPAARSAASEHALFLIVQAISRLGPAAIVPALTAEDFVQTMVDADVGTERFGVGAAMRFGGMVRKVIRWAFQQQGLYHPAANVPQNKAGPPEAIDLHINSERDRADETQVDGTYTAVDFFRNTWHATKKALWVRRNAGGGTNDQQPRADKDNYVYVRVKNLGTDPAAGVGVDLHWAPLAGGNIQDFQTATWQKIGPLAGNVPAGGQRVFGPFVWHPPAGAGVGYALLAAASCAGDRANIDPVTELPCAVTTQPLNTAHLVAWDNNLGLRVVTTA